MWIKPRYGRLLPWSEDPGGARNDEPESTRASACSLPYGRYSMAWMLRFIRPMLFATRQTFRLVAAPPGAEFVLSPGQRNFSHDIGQRDQTHVPPCEKLMRPLPGENRPLTIPLWHRSNIFPRL
jgi:hypothetical protein